MGMTPMLLAIWALAQAVDPAAPVDPASQARLAAAAPALAALPSTTLGGYPVEGASPRAIRAAMNRDRPTEREGGARFDSVTRWSYAARWQRSAGGECDPATAQVSMTVTITLPDLIARDRLSTRERADWDGYFGRLAGHEQNHFRIAAEGAVRMQAAMRAATSCDQMRTEQRRVSEEISAASREYDRLTEHGRREGAVYPVAGTR